MNRVNIKAKSPLHKNTLVKSKSQYLKQNSNPNIQIPNCQSHSSLVFGNEPRIKNSKSSTSHTQSTQRYSINRKSVNKKAKTNNNQNRTNCEDNDLIKLQNIAINNVVKGMQSHLHNAMNKQIQKQKQQIVNLNNIILSIQHKENINNKQIIKMKQQIQELIRELKQLQQSEQQQYINRYSQQKQYLIQQNHQLKEQRYKMQQMIKNLLLERQKSKLSLSSN